MSDPFAASDALFAEDMRTLGMPTPEPVSPPANDSDTGRGPVQLTVPSLEPYTFAIDNGSKWSGGFGRTEFLIPDYWTLRQRSIQLFETNLYARGLIRRLITNEINTGLHLEARPEEAILGFAEDSLADWSENVENRFGIWEANPILCDANERMTFGEIQAAARRESLIAGDVLVVRLQDTRTMLPRVQLISGQAVQTPMDYLSRQYGTLIRHGVEVDNQGRHVAFHIQQPNGTSKRLPAYGEKSGRRMAWLLYGTDNRLDDIRGKPLLAQMLQTLRDIDRYRDATLVKAQLNAFLALYVTKTHELPNTMPLTNGAVRKGTEAAMDGRAIPRRFQTQEHIPGLVIEELQAGEEPKACPNQGVDQKFGDFERAMISLVAWSYGIPPEILTLSFNSNYSASQAAINEFKMVLNENRTRFGDNFCQPLYQEWLMAEVLADRITAPGLLEAWRDSSQFATLGAWFSADWSGNIKPAVDQSKLVDGYGALTQNGFSDRTRATRELTGQKYTKTVRRLKLDNQLLADALEPLARVAEAMTPLIATQKNAKEGNTDKKPINQEPDEDEAPEG